MCIGLTGRKEVKTSAPVVNVLVVLVLDVDDPSELASCSGAIRMIDFLLSNPLESATLHKSCRFSNAPWTLSFQSKGA